METNLELYQHKTPIQLRYADLDTYGHVNNKAYLSFLEESRIKYFHDIMQMSLSNLDYGVVVGRIDIQYLTPIELHEKVVVRTRCSKIGVKSFEISSLIMKYPGDREVVAAQAVVTLVSVDMKTGKTTENNPTAVAHIKDYESIE